MKTVLFTLIAGIMLTGGCSSAAENHNAETSAAETAAIKESPPPATEPESNSLPASSPAPATEEKPAIPDDSRKEEPDESASAPESTAPDRLARIRGPKPATPGAPAGPEIEALRTTHEGPENSFFFTELGQIAVETRVFRSHPLLSKIEKLNDGHSQSIKVYLKDGRIVPLPGGAVKSIFTASSAEILSASGIKSDARRKPETVKPSDGDTKNDEKNRPR